MFLMPLVTGPRVKIWLFLYWLIIYQTFSYWSIFYCLWGQTPGHILKLPITIFLSFKTITRVLLSIFEFLVLDRTVSGQLVSFISYLILPSYKWVPRGIWIFPRLFMSPLPPSPLPSVYPRIIYTEFLLLQGWLHWFLVNTKWFRLHLIPFKKTM